jgi:hypothetical protein
MLGLVSPYVIAVAGGWFVAGSVLRLLALIAAAPGLRALIEAIRAAGLPLRYVYPLLTNYVPVLLFAFIVGVLLFKFVRGNRGWLLVAAVLPWAGYVAYWYFLFCVNTDITCVGASPFHEILGLIDVPLGFAIAALATRRNSPPNPNMSINTDDEGRQRASLAPFLRRRSSSR